MPPGRRGRQRGPGGRTSDVEEALDDENSSARFSEQRIAKGKGRAAVKARSGAVRMTQGTTSKTLGSGNAVPDVFQDMLAETLSSSKVDVADKPRKRRRVRDPEEEIVRVPMLSYDRYDENHDDDDMSVEFEDVMPPKQEQTVYNDSEEISSEDDDLRWEEVGMDKFASKNPEPEDDDGDLDLTLVAEKVPRKVSATTKRKALSKADRALRLNIHKMHLLCLLSHVDRRNSWSNDSEVQSALKPLVSKQMIECLNPKESYSQFGKAESIKKGLSLVTKMWESNYSITSKGIHKPFWAETEKSITSLRLSPESDNLHEKSEFKLAARGLKGSRDVGAQLFCALLRGLGLEVRLVCSLQVLPFLAGVKAPSLNGIRSSPVVAKISSPELSGDDEPVKMQSTDNLASGGGSAALGMPFNPRRRLGHPNAADYFMPSVNSSSRIASKTKPKPKPIRESPYPVFWVEVLDEAHQKWMPINPMDVTSVNKPRDFEPPASDPENNMSYVVAFEDDGGARDVTRRYTKAFNAKTIKSRVESTEGGERWWRRTMRFYSRGWKSDLDQIEDTELAAAEAREPMPKSVADFKNHPVYALERHLRRNEVMFNPREVGKVAAGRDVNGVKRLESVYRRRDVRTVKSADGWYRIGQEVKMGEQPAKIVAPRRQSDEVEEDEEKGGTALYTEDQTEQYVAPPVVNGRVPKNSYGNLDVYVSSMVPMGGVHIPEPEASRAARILGIDYADAVTGFEFRGRHGTAVIKGIVAAAEYKNAIEAVIDGFSDEQARAEEEMRSLAALHTWKRFMISLRIKERVDGYEIEGEGEEAALTDAEAHDNDSGMESEEYIDDGGGGFFPE